MPTRSRAPRSARVRVKQGAAGAVVATLAFVLSLLVVTPATAASETVGAAASTTVSHIDAAAGPVADTGIVKTAVVGFNPENIISDALFYDGNAMSSAEIQSFLDNKIGRCENGKCLNVLTASISSRDAWYSQVTGDLVCSALQGGTMRVSELIYRVQVACGISAKAILVTLQKEQGLTTSSAPSDWNLRAAMGASCPDTEPCDPAYSGVGPQIVQGVRQLKIYKAGRFGKQPGVNFIGYNPSASCGGTNLNIQNYATAALYNYTPYQPNAASLAAGWGLGDGCSSYGNRNFFNYYTSWFGSPQLRDGGLYNVGADIFLLSAGTRFHITEADWPAFNAAFGAPAAVSASALTSTTTDGGDATRFLRDRSTYTVAYLDGGTTHRFATCELVAAWGGNCAALTQVGTEVFARAGAGPEMTVFARRESAGRIHEITGSSLIPYLDDAALKRYTGVSHPFAAVMSARVVAMYRIEPVRSLFAPGQLVRAAGDDRVWLLRDGGSLLYVPSFGVTDDLGLSRSVAVVPAADFGAWTQAGTLSPVVSCGGSAYLGASGTLFALGDASGVTVSDVGAAVCGVLRLSPDAAGAVFVKVPGGPEVFALQGGSVRHVTSMATLVQLAGTSTPRILVVTEGTRARFPTGPALT